MFLPAEKALAVLRNNGVNSLNACDDSAALPSAIAPLPIPDPITPIAPLIILPDTTAPTAYPEFLIS